MSEGLRTKLSATQSTPLLQGEGQIVAVSLSVRARIES